MTKIKEWKLIGIEDYWLTDSLRGWVKVDQVRSGCVVQSLPGWERFVASANFTEKLPNV
jgi:hypothetical protein